MKLVNMKLTKEEREPMNKETVAVDAPAYPWGLSINLDDRALEKLGIDKLPKTDTQMQIIAIVDVTNVSSNESSRGGKNRSVSLQITDLALGPKPAKKDAAATLYAGEE